MKILQNSDMPIYKQISTQFKEQILSGELKEGNLLPSIRALARDLKISVITTMKAYEELAAEGLVTSVPGKGYIVNAQDRQMLQEQHMRILEQHLQNAIDAARVAGVSREQLTEMLNSLYSLENLE